jgi:tRNA(fMet)-specific endonuclease VapC
LIGNLVLDTDIASFVFKGDTRVELYRHHIDGKLWAVSFQTVAELEQWALLRGWGERRKRDLDEFLSTFVIVNPDRELCRFWGRVRVGAKRKGRPIDTADA